MSKRGLILTISFLLAVIFLPATSVAIDENPCLGVDPISVNIVSDPLVRTNFRNSLLYYPDKHGDKIRGKYYCLLFSYPEGPLNVAENFSFQLLDDKNVILDGIQLIRKDGFQSVDPFLTLDQGGSGGIVIIRNAIIDGTNKAAPCMEINSKGTVVKSSDISNCSEGIRIKTNKVLIGADDAEHYEDEKNTIHDNKIGIHVVSGGANRFAYNSIFNNISNPANPTTDDAIFIEPALGIERPEIILINDVTRDALHCEKDSDGKISTRWLQISGVEKGKKIIIHESYSEQDKPKQAINLIDECVIEEGGKCLIQLPDDLNISPDKCGTAIYAVALVDTQTYSSMLNADQFLFKLDGPVAVISAPTETMPVEMPQGVTETEHGGSEIGDLASGSSIDQTAEETGWAAAGNPSGTARCGLAPGGVLGASQLFFYLTGMSAGIAGLFLLRKKIKRP